MDSSSTLPPTVPDMLEVGVFGRVSAYVGRYPGVPDRPMLSNFLIEPIQLRPDGALVADLVSAKPRARARVEIEPEDWTDTGRFIAKVCKAGPFSWGGSLAALQMVRGLVLAYLDSKRRPGCERGR